MSAITASFIEKKKEEKDSNGLSTPNWGGFLADVIFGLVITLIFGLLGANFVFLVSQEGSKLFPTNPYAPPYSDREKGREFLSGARKKAAEVATKAKDTLKKKALQLHQLKKAANVGGQSGGALSTCGENGKKSQTLDAKASNMLDKMSGISHFSFPYTMITKDKDDSLFAKFKTWIGESIKYSYTSGREIIGHILTWIRGACADNFIPEWAIFILGVPLVLTSLWIVPFFGAISTFIGEIVSGWIWALVFFFIGFDFTLASGIGFIQFFQFLSTFLLLPAILDIESIKKILKKHHKIMGILFALFTVSAAFTHLGSVFGMGEL